MIAKLPHELYGLSDDAAAKVLKHISASYTSGRMPAETILSYDGCDEEKNFCAFYVGYIIGLHTQRLFPSTATILQAATRTGNPKLIEAIARDIAQDLSAPAEEIKNAILKLIDSGGKKPSGGLWSHAVYGIFMGVDHQAVGAQNVESVLYFLAEINDLSVEDVAAKIARRRAELHEGYIR